LRQLKTLYIFTTKWKNNKNKKFQHGITEKTEGMQMKVKRKRIEVGNTWSFIV